MSGSLGRVSLFRNQLRHTHSLTSQHRNRVSRTRNKVVRSRFRGVSGIGVAVRSQLFSRKAASLSSANPSRSSRTGMTSVVRGRYKLPKVRTPNGVVAHAAHVDPNLIMPIQARYLCSSADNGLYMYTLLNCT